MKPFSKFKKKHILGQKSEEVPEEVVTSFTNVFPSEFLTEWRENGWCSYGDGLFWTVNPEDYYDILEDWLEMPDESHAFLRTAFGGIFFRCQEDNYFLDVLEGDVSRVFHRVDYVFDGTLCDKSYLESVILLPLFKEAVSKFGALESDECYGVFPPPALGGEVKLESLEKVKLREYLTILNQTLV